MSATQELIAAALTTCDVAATDYEGAYRAKRDLREACARAMVQPDIAEVERLADEYSDSVVEMARERKNKYLVAQRDTDRTALLDAVRAIVAERDALKHDVERLTLENKALKYSLQLDEELIGKIQEVISVIANRPEVSK